MRVPSLPQSFWRAQRATAAEGKMNSRARIASDRRAVVLVVAVVAVALVASGTLLVSSPPVAWTYPASTPATSSSGSPEPQPSVATPPSAPAEVQWGSLALAPITLIADLRPSHSDGTRVALDSAFVLTSTSAVPAVEIARTVTVEPSVALTTASRPDGSITLRPSSPLEPGALYRFTARAPDGSLAGSWAFQAASPLRVVGTLPADSATGVPVTTGIELTFDQDGKLDAAGHLSIDPNVTGTLEQHGRTVVFVPERLAPATVYTVALSSGVGLAGSSQRLENAVRFRFETAGPDEAPARTIVFDRAMVEATPDEQAVLAFASWASGGGDPGPQPVAVYRLASASAGLEAARTLTTAPTWAMWGSAGVVPTAGLPRVVSFDAHPQDLGDGNEFWFRLPAPLPVGWYLVVIAGERRDAQAMLQVTDVATYSAVSTTRTVLWANDARAGSPLADAVVRLGRVVLGRTDGQGLLDVPTPPGLAEAATDPSLDAAVLSVTAGDGRIAYVPVAPGDGGSAYPWDIARWGGTATDPWWHLLATDRLVYRSSDSVNAWGLVRSREGISPSSVEIRLLARSGYTGTLMPETPPIATIDARLDAAGVFAQRIPISDLPTGSYTLELRVDGKAVATRLLSVDVIRKPAYEVTVATNRRAVIVGDPVTLEATVRFFDGTPVPGTPLAVSLFDQTAVTTDAEGGATVTRRATIQGDQSWDLAWASVAPARTEEGEIAGSSAMLVFPSSHWVEGSGTVVDDRGAVTGSVHEVALDRLQAFDPQAFGPIEPKGAPVAGGTVAAVITELVPVRTRTIQSYDFIEKRVVDSYEYDIERHEAGRKTIVTGADGSFRIEFPAGTGHDYEVDLRTTDERGLTMHATVYAGKPYASLQPGTRPYLGRQAVCGGSVDSYATGEPISLTMRDGKGPLPQGGMNRYLFLTAQQGIRDAVVQESATYETTFTAADAPNLTIAGVRFTGRTYVPATSTTAVLQKDERAITVSLAADRQRYAPGDTVRLSIQTRDADGGPVRASVVLRAVDEKLYAIGDARAEASLDDLYAQVSSGLAWSHSSHPLPIAMTLWGCGDTTGGGGGTGSVTQPRQDFRDWLLFQRVTTGPDGRASASFRLSDDLTSWHVAATAATAGLGAGDGDLLVPVGLPFFVEATVAPEYLLSDRPVLRLRAFGSALREGDPVAFAVSSASLGLGRTTITGVAFCDVDVPLPALTLGTHQLTIEGSAAPGHTVVRDSLLRSFRVVDTRLTTTETTYLPVTAALHPAPAAGLATYVFSDAGRGRYLGQLFALASSGGARVDEALAASIAHDLLVDRFAVPADSLRPAAFDRTAYQDQGIALLPYASPDLALSARIALLAPDGFDTDALRQLFIATRNDPASTREQHVIADSALASLRANVLPDLRSWAADPSLTIRERLYVALGSTALGDDATALSIERSLLTSYGERLGGWARLRTGASLDDTIEATALAALVAARVGDPVAGALEQYVADNPARDDLYALQQVAFVAAMLDRLPASRARFAFTVAGQREVVDLGTGGAYVLTLTPAQQASLVLDPVQGSVGLALSRQVPFGSAAMRTDPSLRLVRTISTGSGDIRSDAPVEVILTATFGPQAVDDCYTVTDLVPSGLVPVTNVAPWPSADAAARSTLLSPSRVDAQRVEFCASPGLRSRTASMHYFARVSTTGSYLWEPAMMQSARAPESLALTGSDVITAR